MGALLKAPLKTLNTSAAMCKNLQGRVGAQLGPHDAYTDTI